MRNTKQNNPLLCDIETGVCEVPTAAENTTNTAVNTSALKPVKVLYYTDPICSSCWGIEPQLRKLKLEYGHTIDLAYRMGGLLPNWQYNKDGISHPSHVAHHWDEVSLYYDMPIDGDIWLEDPLCSSYPPSIAFKAAQLQSREKAILFLREIREMVFLRKQNIAKWSNLVKAAKVVGLHIEQLETAIKGEAKTLFEKDLALARELGVKGFPTLFFVDAAGNKEFVCGARSYAYYEEAIVKLVPTATKTAYKKSWQDLFGLFPTLTTREFAELAEIPRDKSEQTLNELLTKGFLVKQTSKNGSIWTTK